MLLKIYKTRTVPMGLDHTPAGHIGWREIVNLFSLKKKWFKFEDMLWTDNITHTP